MNFDEYQVKANETAIYPEKNSVTGFMYCLLGLNGEADEALLKLTKIFAAAADANRHAGTIAEFGKKCFRDKKLPLSPDDEVLIVKELGDQLWYVAQIATELGLSLDDIAQVNIRKLHARKINDRLHGSGDNR